LKQSKRWEGCEERTEKDGREGALQWLRILIPTPNQKLFTIKEGEYQVMMDFVLERVL
jgi:hypothetical protein